MLKQRLIAFLPVKGGIVVQSIDFERYLPVGKPQIAVEALNQWGIDEIILADIEATPFGRCIDREMVRDVSKVCFVPLTVGGGVSIAYTSARGRVRSNRYTPDSSHRAVHLASRPSRA